MFSEDLKEGQQAEQEFANWAIKEGLSVERIPGNFAPYDMIVYDDVDQFKIEVKLDRKAHYTGNVGIELYKQVNGVDMPSGLSGSEADTFVFKLLNIPGMFAIPTHKLRKLAEEKKYKAGKWCGDGGRTYMLLFDKEFFLTQCNYLD